MPFFHGRESSYDDLNATSLKMEHGATFTGASFLFYREAVTTWGLRATRRAAPPSLLNAARPHKAYCFPVTPERRTPRVDLPVPAQKRRCVAPAPGPAAPEGQRGHVLSDTTKNETLSIFRKWS